MMFRPGIKAVGFDMDGTFMNTHVDYPKLSRVIPEVMEEEGIPMNDLRETDSEKMGIPFGWVYDAGRWDEIDIILGKIGDRRTEIEKEYYKDSSPFPLAVETMLALKHKGYKVGILTRGGREYAEAVLGLWNVYDSFDAVVCRDDFPFEDEKPSPMAMKHLADGMGVKPEEILYVGDNLTDWYTAKNSGAEFVGVLSGSCSYGDWKENGVENIIDGVGNLMDYI
ncbi:MAG: HAD family hydrolase [Candidatus Methanomethylophilaceae archaeon]|jgi:HAD superfamily hydrolase (TIGR01549 family)